MRYALQRISARSDGVLLVVGDNGSQGGEHTESGIAGRTAAESEHDATGFMLDGVEQELAGAQRRGEHGIALVRSEQGEA